LEIKQPKEIGVNNSPEPVQRSRQTWLARVGQFLTSPHHSILEVGARRQAQLLAALTLGYTILSLISIPATWMARKALTNAMLALLPVIALALVAYILSRTRYYQIGAWLLVISLVASTFGQVQGGADIGGTLLFSTALAFVIGSALFSYRAMLIFVLLDALISPFLLNLIAPEIGMARLGAFGGYILTTGVLIIIVMAFRNSLESQRLEELKIANRELTDIRTNLEKHVEERTFELATTSEESRKRAAQLVAISEVSRAITQLQNINELLPAIVELISQRFGYYHVGIFLLDESRKNVTLRATNSEAGKRMLERGHRVEVGQNSIVGYVAAQGESRISLDLGTDPVQNDNPDLPATRSEMALPLLAGGQQVIGVLDLQSDLPTAFRPQDVRIMSTLADQVAIAIENVRLYSETQQALADSQTAYRLSLKQEWAKIARESERVGYQFTAEGIVPLAEALNSLEVESALETGETVEAAGDMPAIAVPVKLREETIGVLNIRASNAERKWSENELALVQAIAERVALALENARLLSDASRRAEQERTISDITTKIGSSSQLDIILQTAVKELGRLYDDSEIVLQIGGKAAKE
jgi:GAF domain-containing protein